MCKILPPKNPLLKLISLCSVHKKTKSTRFVDNYLLIKYRSLKCHTPSHGIKFKPLKNPKPIKPYSYHQIKQLFSLFTNIFPIILVFKTQNFSIHCFYSYKKTAFSSNPVENKKSAPFFFRIRVHLHVTYLPTSLF